MWRKCVLLFLCFHISLSLVGIEESESPSLLSGEEFVNPSSSILVTLGTSPMIQAISKELTDVISTADVPITNKAMPESSQSNKIEDSSVKTGILGTQLKATSTNDNTETGTKFKNLTVNDVINNNILVNSIKEPDEANHDPADETASKSQTLTEKVPLEISEKTVDFASQLPKPKKQPLHLHSRSKQKISFESDLPLEQLKVMDASQSPIFRTSEVSVGNNEHNENAKSGSENHPEEFGNANESVLTIKEPPTLVPPTEIFSENLEDAESIKTSSDTDNMPSFKEWTEKRLAEQEKIVGGNGASTTSAQGKNPSISKIRQKNYASSNCGAKIIGTNSESQGSSAVLNSFHDEYMLNPCTAKIWLVIELCEPIQAQKIEIANFELFSSSPKEFAVYSSDRYPSRDWILLGSYEATDEKTIQSFSFDQQAFHKFLKLEFSSHYGSEHYCPLSLVHVYGTSELEVLDNDNEADSFGNHYPDEESLQGGSNVQPQNLFGSAKDAVLSIVKKAAEALSRDKQNQEMQVNNGTLNESALLLKGTQIDSANAYSLSSQITLQQPCLNYSTKLFHYETTIDIQAVEKFLSTNFDYLNKFLQSPVILDILESSSLCARTLTLPSNFSLCEMQSRSQYLQALLGPIRYAALCYLYSLKKTLEMMPSYYKTYSDCAEVISLMKGEVGGKTLTTSTVIAIEPGLDPHISSIITEFTSIDTESEKKLANISEIESIQTGSSLSSKIPSSISLQEQIHPTKTLKSNDQIEEKMSNASSFSIGNATIDDSSEKTVSSASSSKDATTLASDISEKLDVSNSISETPLLESSLIPVIETIDSSSLKEESVILSPGRTIDNSQSTSVDPVSVLDATNCGNDHLLLSDSLLLDLSETGIPAVPQIPSPLTSVSTSSTASGGANKTSIPSAVQKESIFVRLTNRIKTLELNMSLSSQYLEELSQRYRKQMEEMQKAFNKTIAALNETAEKAYEQDLRQQESINVLHMQINDLIKTMTILQAERETSSLDVLEHALFIFIELFIATLIFLMCKRRVNTLTNPLRLDKPLEPLSREETDSEIASDVSSEKRRNSFAGATNVDLSLSKHKRTASDEVPNESGTCSDVMIIEPIIPITRNQPLYKAENRKKKNRSKKNSREMKSLSSQTLASETLPVNSVQMMNNCMSHDQNSVNNRVTSAGLLFSSKKDDAKLCNGVATLMSSNCQTVPNVHARIETNGSCSSTLMSVYDKTLKQTSSAKRKHSRVDSGCVNSVLQEKCSSTKSFSKVCNGDACFAKEDKETFLFQKVFLRLYSIFR